MLSDEDRGDLIGDKGCDQCRWTAEWCPACEDRADGMEPAVEAIVARHVAAALNEAASRIDGQTMRHMFAAENKMRGPKERDEHHAAQVASEDAARIVRAAIPKPPAEPADPLVRPAGRTPGTT